MTTHATDPDNGSPVKITRETIIRLTEHIKDAFNAFDANGELDLEKCQRNVAYSIGNTYTNYNGILMQERHKLAEINSDLKHLKAMAYDKAKRFTDYVVESGSIKTIVEGNAEVREKQLEYDKQAYYVKFLENTLNQLGYYANGVRVLIEAEKQKTVYGM